MDRFGSDFAKGLGKLLAELGLGAKRAIHIVRQPDNVLGYTVLGGNLKHSLCVGEQVSTGSGLDLS